MPTAPTVIYGDQVLMESGAIIDVILRRHAPGKLMPALDSKDYPWHQIWYQYAEGSLLPRVGTDYNVWQIKPPERRSPLVDSENVIRFAEDWLSQEPLFRRRGVHVGRHHDGVRAALYAAAQHRRQRALSRRSSTGWSACMRARPTSAWSRRRGRTACSARPCRCRTRRVRRRA